MSGLVDLPELEVTIEMDGMSETRHFVGSDAAFKYLSENTFADAYVRSSQHDLGGVVEIRTRKYPSVKIVQYFICWDDFDEFVGEVEI